MQRPRFGYHPEPGELQRPRFGYHPEPGEELLFHNYDENVPHVENFPPMSDPPFVMYNITGAYKVGTPFYLSQLPEINRRLSMIIAGSLFYTADLCWKALNSTVAAGLHRHMTEIMHGTNVRVEVGTQPLLRQYETSINSENYIIDEHKRRRWPEPNGPIRYDSSKGGCFEMVVANHFIVVITYVVEIHCRVVVPDYDVSTFRLIPEPHMFWVQLMEHVDKGLKEAHRNVFSNTLADNIIYYSQLYQDLNYVQHRTVHNPNIFMFNG